MVHGDLGQQALETEPGVGGAAALPEVLVDDEDPIGGPAEGAGIISGSPSGDRFRLSQPASDSRADTATTAFSVASG
jgi:hypothetical protein